MGLGQQFISSAYLRRLSLLSRHAFYAWAISERRAFGIGPIRIIKDDPTAGTQQFVHKKEGKAIDKPVVRAIQIAEINRGVGFSSRNFINRQL